MKERSEKVDIKLHIQKTKIMASSPITSWQIDGETVETVTGFILLGSKITADGDCSHEIKRCLLLGRKASTNLSSVQFSHSVVSDRFFATPWTAAHQASLSLGLSGKNTGVGCHFLLQCVKVKSESEVAQCVWLLATPWTVAYQAPPPMGFSRQEYWSGVPLPSVR